MLQPELKNVPLDPVPVGGDALPLVVGDVELGGAGEVELGGAGETFAEAGGFFACVELLGVTGGAPAVTGRATGAAGAFEVDVGALLAGGLLARVG